MKKYLFYFRYVPLLLVQVNAIKKIDRINKEISFSKAHNDTARTLSLELALKQVQNDCAKDPMFYDKKLEAKKLKEQEVEKWKKSKKNSMLYMIKKTI